uniref:Uncharacterized protein n=1 Tax=Ditylenchus dipsaci TaxID=166011 RepID=A0A915E3A4_9BILA
MSRRITYSIDTAKIQLLDQIAMLKQNGGGITLDFAKKAREILRERDKVNVGSNALEQLGQQQIIGSQSLNETFDILGNTIKSLDQELDRLYDTFRTKSSTMKKRVTVLEKVYRENRTEIKNDYYKKSLRV